MKSGGLVFYPNHGHGLVRALSYFPHVRPLRAHFFGQVGTIHLWNRVGLGYQLFRVTLDSRDNAAHYSVVAKMPHQGARIDVRQHRHLEFLQIFLGHLLRAPVRTAAREFAHDQPFNPGAGGFVVFLVGAVVANFWIVQDDGLSWGARLSEDFLVARDVRLTYDSSVAFA